MSAASPRIRVNGRARPLVARDVAELVRELGLEGRSGIAVAVNGAVVRRAAWAERVLEADDDVELVGAAQGG